MEIIREKIIGEEPAYPEVQLNPKFNFHTYGLTIRQIFAMEAMQGLISSNNNNGNASAFMPIEEQANISVCYADALIEALNKEKT